MVAPTENGEKPDDVTDLIRKIVAVVSPSKRATPVQIRNLTAAITAEFTKGVGSEDGSPPVENGGRRSTTPRQSLSRTSSTANISVNGCLPTSSRASKMLAIARSHSPSPASSSTLRPSPVADVTPVVGILSGHGTNKIREERRMKQRRHDRRKRQQLARDRAMPLPIDVEEVDLPHAMHTTYGQLLLNTNDPIDIFHVLMKTLETCYAKHTWQESVTETTKDFSRIHLRQSIQALNSAHYERDARIDEKMREYEVQTILHLQAMAEYEKKFSTVSQEAVKEMVSILYALQLNSTEPSRMQDFLMQACFDEFEATAWRHLIEVFGEMGFDLPFDLQYRSEHQGHAINGVDRSSSPFKSFKSETSLTWADLDTSSKRASIDGIPPRKRGRPPNSTAVVKTEPKPTCERKRRVTITRTVATITPVKEQMPLSEKRARKCRRLLNEDQLNDSVDDTPFKSSYTKMTETAKATRSTLVKLVSKLTKRQSRVKEDAQKLISLKASSPQPPTPKRRRISDFLFTHVMYSSEKKSPAGRLRSSAVKEEQGVDVKPVLQRARKNLLQSPVKTPTKSVGKTPKSPRESPRHLLKSPKFNIATPTKSPATETSSGSPKQSTSRAAKGESKYRNLPPLIDTAVVCASGPSETADLGEYRIPPHVVDNYHHSVRAMKVRRKDGEYPVFYGRDAVRINVFSTSAEQVGRIVMSTRSNGNETTMEKLPERKTSTSTASGSKTSQQKHSSAKNRAGKKLRKRPTATSTSACACPLLNVLNANPQQLTLVKHIAAKIKTPVKVQKCTRVFTKAKHQQMKRRVRALHERVRKAKAPIVAEDTTSHTTIVRHPSVCGTSDGSEPTTVSAAEHTPRGRHSVAGSPTAQRC